MFSSQDDEQHSGNCAFPGYATGKSEFDGIDSESLSLSSAIVHPGGEVTLRCKETFGNVDIARATLSAIKVDSLG
jgi:hypothetical protein